MRTALRFPWQSLFFFFHGSGCESSLNKLTGLNHSSFNYVLQKIKPYYDRFTPYTECGYVRLRSATKRGRPRHMYATTSLGLFLAHTRTRGSLTNLTLIFGCTASVCSLYIRLARLLFFYGMTKDGKAAVQMLAETEAQFAMSLISANYPLLENVYCFADGVKLRLQKCGDEVVQSMFYNGWTHDHYVTNILTFSHTGVIIACGLNAPGSMHDSDVAFKSGVYQKLEVAHEQWGDRCVIDSAFSRSRYPFLLKSSPNITVTAANAVELERGRQATSLRQSAEWGMRGFQSRFPRVHDRMRYELYGERRMFLTSLVLLFNVRTRLVGLNQITTVFKQELTSNANSWFSQFSPS